MTQISAYSRAVFYEHTGDEYGLSATGPSVRSGRLETAHLVSSEKQFRFRQSFQSARPMSGRSVRTFVG